MPLLAWTASTRRRFILSATSLTAFSVVVIHATALSAFFLYCSIIETSVCSLRARVAITGFSDAFCIFLPEDIMAWPLLTLPKFIER